MAEDERLGGHWRGHPLLAAAVRAAVLLAPLALSIVVGLAVGQVLPVPHTAAAKTAWWAVVLATSTATMAAVEPLARRVLPLAVLLDLALLFPDRAPSRFKIALKSGSVKHVHEFTGAPETAETIVTLVAALGAHHRPSRKHSERVRAYTELIAEELRLPPKDRHRLRWAALLHDIGKVDVPVEVLNGTGPLSEAGWQVIHRHPVDGDRLITPLKEWLGPWAKSVEQHHERIDGTGYPGGLKGEEICLGARIVAVADSFEAMTARRSYQEALPLDRARQRLADLSGTHFDPAVVRAFLAVSISRLRLAYGPLAWLAETPALAGFARVGSTLTAAGARTGAAALGVTMAAAATGGPPQPTNVAALTFTRSAPAVVRAAARSTAAAPTPLPSQNRTATSTPTTAAARGAGGQPGRTTTTGVLPTPAGSAPVTLPTTSSVTLPVSTPTTPTVTEPTVPSLTLPPPPGR